MTDDRFPFPSDATMPSRSTAPAAPGVGAMSAPPARPTQARRPTESAPAEAPGLLLQSLNGEIDLETELCARYPQMPIMALLHIRHTGVKTPRGIATLSTQDGAASLNIEIDLMTKAAQFTFITSGMLGLRFSPGGLTDTDRGYWLDGMQRSFSETIFLWGGGRWESDYLVCAPRRHYTSIFAFSPASLEAAARLTREVTTRLTEWLVTIWG